MGVRTHGGADPGVRPFGGRVVLVDRRALVAESLSLALANAGVTAKWSRDVELEIIEREVTAYDPDAVLINVAADRALELVRAIGNMGTPVLVVTDGVDDLRVAECVEAGAIGTVNTLDPIQVLLMKLRDVVAGRRILPQSREKDLLHELRLQRRDKEQRLAPFSSLTARETDVLTSMMDGLPAVEIAELSYVSVATIRSQIKAILRKLGVNSQLAAVALAYQAGWSKEAQLPRTRGRGRSRVLS